MSDPQFQPELDLIMSAQPFDQVVVIARMLLDRPEVEYRILWTPINGRQVEQKCFCDAIWPMDKMSARILGLLISAHNDGPWLAHKVRATLDAVQSAYGCEEPF